KLQILAEADGELWNRRLQPTDDPPVEETAVDVAAALEQALASRPELAAADAVVAQRQAQQDYARSQRLPALDLVLSHDRFGLAGTIASDGSPIPGLPGEVPVDLAGDFGDSWSRLREGDFDDTRVGLVLEIPLGNRSARAQATAATLAREQAEA